MKDETETLRRIIADCVAAELRELQHDNIDVHDVGYRVAREVLQQLRRVHIQAISTT